AKKTLSKVFQSATFPVIKYAVRVIGSDSRTISGLSTGNFQVKENGIAQTITNVEFQSTNAPVDIALCLDTSGSINDIELAQINSSAGKFIDCFGPSGRGAIYKFSSNVSLIHGFTSDKGSLKNAINASPPGRGLTSLNDAVYDAMALCRQSQNRKAVVALTDGYDNDSSHSLQQITDYSSENQVPVFTLGLGSPLNVSLLQSMATQCRGIYFNAINVSKLDEVFNKVAEDVHSRYVITYTTSNSVKDGTTRSVETTAVHGANSGSATFQYRAPQGIKPTAQIVSISPNPGSLNQPVSFSGIGVDSDGTIVEYSWRSSINGIIGNQETFQISSLSEGNHTIYLKVKDNDNFWSDEVSAGLTVLNKTTISGKIRYENRIFNETGTGAPNAVEFKPVRFAKVEIIRASDNAVVGTGQTNGDGTYNIEAKASLNDKVYLKCYSYTSEENNNYHIAVIRDFSPPDNDHYKDTEQKTVSQDSLTIDLDITEESGEGGAFNIFDCLVDGIDKVRELSGSTLPPPPIIPVIWEKGKEAGTGYDPNASPSYIVVNGKDTDPDEYDDSVLLHEYGHFVMDNYSCDKSPGGDHQANDINQDIRLSWSEGWADYFSGMVMGKQLYIDTGKVGTNEKTTLNIENLDYYNSIDGLNSLVNIATGQDTEVSVSSILWDLYDSTNEDADTQSLGAKPIWDVFCKINDSNDCVLEDFHHNLIDYFQNYNEEFFYRQINNIFASRKVFYSDLTFKRGKIFINKDSPKHIPDGKTSIEDIMPPSEIEVTDDLFVKDVNVFVDITHSRRRDLGITLISPDNTEVILEDYSLGGAGQTEDIFAWYQKYETQPYQEIDTVLEGKNTKGIWKLKVIDRDNQDMLTDEGLVDDIGKLNRWKLEIKGTPKKIELNLQQGWNFISFPLLPQDKRVENVLSSINGSYSQVSRYNADKQSFENYVVDEPKYRQFNSFEYARGYQIYITNPSGCSLTLTGEPISTQVVSLKKGWNFIGSPKTEDIAADDVLIPLKLDYDYSRVCRYNLLTKEFEDYYGIWFKMFPKFKPGEAYYLKCIKDVNWTVEP
ncbi:MAG: VWA domain-containing protein, partial [Candidatus Omnitrophota bacterium]